MLTISLIAFWISSLWNPVTCLPVKPMALILKLTSLFLYLTRCIPSVRQAPSNIRFIAKFLAARKWGTYISSQDVVYPTPIIEVSQFWMLFTFDRLMWFCMKKAPASKVNWYHSEIQLIFNQCGFKGFLERLNFMLFTFYLNIDFRCDLGDLAKQYRNIHTILFEAANMVLFKPNSEIFALMNVVWYQATHLVFWFQFGIDIR